MSRRTKNDLIVRVRYSNPLPEPPCPPKILNIPTTPARYGKPEFTDALFDDRPYPMQVDAEMGMPLELSRFPGLWGEMEDDAGMHPDEEPPMAPEDAFLFEHIAPVTQNGHSAASLPNVSWLRKTEYISRESINRGPVLVPDMRPEEIAVDVSRERQLQIIEESFAAITDPDLSKLRHPSKPHLKAVGTFDVLPDTLIWPDKYDVYKFSERPGDKGAENADERLDAALLRPMEADGEHFLSYYLADSDETVGRFKRKRETEEPEVEEETFDFKFVRDYEAMKTENDCQNDFLLVFDEEGIQDGEESHARPAGAFYKPIERRIWLRKKRVRKNEVLAQGSKWDIIHVSHVPLDEEDVETRREAQDELQDPEHWIKRALAAEMDAEGDPDAEGEIDMEPKENGAEVEVGMGKPGDIIVEVPVGSEVAREFEEGLVDAEM